MITLWIAPATVAQVDPATALAAMETPPDLAVSLFAAEPDLRNPTAMDIDARGRIWITEAANYRLFNHPTADPAGDRIRVLEDTDGDGVCDQASTWYQDPSLQAPIGIAVLGDRVYVCQSPDLFYLEDTDGDGKADKKTVVLSGFAGVDHDHAIHGLHFGPDGWLYLSVGDSGLDVTDKSGNRVIGGKAGEGKPAATLLRCDLDGNHLEMIAWGMRNPYEPAENSFGTLFISDNDDDGNQQCQFNYIMEGGNYGYWPRRKGDRHDPAVHWNKDLPGVAPNVLRTGFGSPTGLHEYEGQHLPDRFFGTILHADAGPGVIRAYKLSPKGAGYDAEIEILLSCKEDKWFRPSDVCVAPDGSVFVADWYDPGVGGHRMGDTAQGRVYRVAQPGAKYTVATPDVSTPAAASVALLSPNRSVRYLAWQALAQAARANDTAALEALYASEHSVNRARALWLLAESPEKGAAVVEGALHDSSVDIQVQAVRMLCRRDAAGIAAALALADSEAPQVRRQLLLELARIEDRQPHFKQLVALAAHYDGQDRFYREAIGIAFQGLETEAYAALRKKLGKKWTQEFSQLAIQLHPESAFEDALKALKNPKLALELRKDAAKTLDAIGTPEAGKSILGLLEADQPVELQTYALQLLARDGGDIWRDVTREADLEHTLTAMLERPELTASVYQYIADARNRPLLPTLFTRGQNATLPVEGRIAALQCAREVVRQEDLKTYGLPKDTILALLADTDPAIAAEGIALLGLFHTDEAHQMMGQLVLDPNRPKEFRSACLNTLAGSEAGQVLLLDAVEQRTLPQDLLLQTSDLAHASRFENVRLMAAQLLPREQTREGQALPSLKELAAMTGDPVRGREVFFQAGASQCYQCHLVQGEGGKVGPDLSVIGQKLSKEALLESILNPSAAISHEYEVWLLRTEWEGFVSGILHSETADAVELLDATGATTRIETKDILERRKSTTSLMPTGLVAGLSVEELTNLVAYLGTLK